MNTILEQDFKHIYQADLPWEKIKGKTIFVTGATGFIGSLIIRFLDYVNQKHNLNVRVIVLVRSLEKARKQLSSYKIEIIQGDVCSLPQIPTAIDFIIHCAAITNSKEMIEKPVEVTEGIVQGTSNLMKLSFEKKVESVVFLSSMEVYGRTSGEGKVEENMLGDIDIFNTRSCYPLGKRMAESICYSYFSQYNIPVKVARLAQTFGAGISESENRVFAQFAKSVLQNEDIVLHTDGASMGNYCYSADALKALFVLLLKGKDGQAYNVVNEDASMTIKEMAHIVAEKVSQNKISVKYEIPSENKFGYAVPNNTRLSAKKLKELDWEAKYNLEEMYKRMLEYFTDNDRVVRS